MNQQRHVADAVHQNAKGSLAAQKARHDICEEGADPEILWLRLIELSAEYGWKSVACAAFMREVGKRL